MPEQEQPEKPQIKTPCAFLVYLDENGHWQATPNLHVQIDVNRLATTDDMYLGAITVKRDLEAVNIVQGVLANLQRQSAAFFEHAQHTGLAEAVGARGAIDLSKI